MNLYTLAVNYHTWSTMLLLCAEEEWLISTDVQLDRAKKDSRTSLKSFLLQPEKMLFPPILDLFKTQYVKLIAYFETRKLFLYSCVSSALWEQTSREG